MNVLAGAAGALAVNRFAMIIELHRHGDDVIALFLQERRDDQQRKERFDNALAECQNEMPRITKNGVIDMGGKGKINYARLEDLDYCIRPIYSRRGFSVRYDAPVSMDGGKIRLTAKFSCAGHTEPLEITLPPDTGPGRSAVQAVKASITAGRRHLLEMFFNVIEEGADEAARRDVALITAEQADTLRAKLSELESDPQRFGVMLAKFYKIYQIRGLEFIKATDLDDAYRRIESERTKPKK